MSRENIFEKQEFVSEEVEELRNEFVSGKSLTEEKAKKILHQAIDIFLEEENVVELAAPVTICGDLHGQFFDMLEMFKTCGTPPTTQYVFLGDYVDRGYHGVETFLLLLQLKISHRDKVTMIRGNHESRQVTQTYGFYDECLTKFPTCGAEIWRICCDVFDTLPLAAVIDGSVYCVHGGLSPNAMKLDIVRCIQRVRELPIDGPMCDLMWSDPEEGVDGFGVNPRGAGYVFGQKQVEDFSKLNRTKLVVRSHQLAQAGHQFMFDKTLVTIWSAPNYTYRCGNLAGVLKIKEHTSEATFMQFEKADNQGHQTEWKKGGPDYFL